MAKMKRNIGDLVSGRIGNVVFFQLHGKSYVRAAPVRKKTSWTEDQQFQRQRISKASGLWRALRSEQVSKIWNAAAEQMNGYAWFLKVNLPALEIDGTLIDAKLLKVSDGKLAMPQNLMAERKPDDASTITVSWQNDLHTRGERLNDELMVISYVDGKFSRVMATGLVRGAKGGSFELPVKPVNATHFYLFMASREEYSGSCAF
ncbi:MAG TPA: hypothetical protein DCL77_08230 [Prolixibacteraceae bacterium]|jgi:hypothetical protein|nr:hypothetical protein [Prolixibacteraceae bacterium]